MAERRPRRPRGAPSAKRPPARKQRAVARHPASNTPARRRPVSPRVRRRRAILTTVMLGFGLIVFLFAFVYPTSTYLRQRSDMSSAHRRVQQLEAQTRQLEQDTKKLAGDDAVERIAREQYGLVRPGETPYVLVPTAPSTTVPTTPTTAPPPTKAKPTYP